MRVAVTGASGRLGRRLVDRPRRCAVHGAARAARPGTGRAFDLDAPGAASAPGSTATDPRSSSMRRPGPTSTAAPGTRTLALRRNGAATGILAEACAARGIDLVAISTNEVFDGTRTDGVGYAPDDPPAPPNPYGVSKLAGETARAAAPSPGRRAGAQLGIVRTAWLFGPPGRDFPRKILEAAERAIAAGTAIRASSATSGGRRRTPPTSPTPSWSCSPRTPTPGSHHLVNGLTATRATVGRGHRRAVRPAGRGRARPGDARGSGRRRRRAGACSRRRRCPSGEPLRPWPDAMADYAPLLRSPAGGGSMSDRAMRPGERRVRARRRPHRDEPGLRRSARLVPRALAGERVAIRPMTRAPSRTHGSSRPTCPPRPPASCAASTSIAASSTTGSWRAGGRSSPSSTCGRCSRAADAPRVETRELAADDWVVDPGRRRPRVPGPRAARLLYLVTNEYDGSDELGFAWDDPAAGVPWPPVAETARRAPDPLRPRPREPAAGRAAWCACATRAS